MSKVSKYLKGFVLSVGKGLVGVVSFFGFLVDRVRIGVKFVWVYFVELLQFASGLMEFWKGSEDFGEIMEYFIWI